MLAHVDDLRLTLWHTVVIAAKRDTEGEPARRRGHSAGTDSALQALLNAKPMRAGGRLFKPDVGQTRVGQGNVDVRRRVGTETNNDHDRGRKMTTEGAKYQTT